MRTLDITNVRSRPDDLVDALDDGLSTSVHGVEAHFLVRGVIGLELPQLGRVVAVSGFEVVVHPGHPMPSSLEPSGRKCT
jgi:hypothetical protein